MKSIVAAVAGVIYKDGKILVTKRKPDTYLPDQWEFPGGKIEFGESPEQALMREIREEVDIAITNLQLFTVDSFVYDQTDEARHVILITYKADWKSGEPKTLGNVACNWLDLQEIHNLDTLKSVKTIMKKLDKERKLS